MAAAFSGVMIDYLIAAGVSEPFTKTLLVFTVLSATAIPFFYFAAKRFHKDRDRLFEAMEAGEFSV